MKQANTVLKYVAPLLLLPNLPGAVALSGDLVLRWARAQVQTDLAGGGGA